MKNKTPYKEVQYENRTRFIEKKLGKLDKYFSGDADALVKLSTVGNDKFTMEITVRFGGYIARAEVTGSNMYDNIDLILPKLEKQIARFRDRMNSKVPKKALPLKTDVEEAAAPREYYGNIVKEKHFDISIVTVDEAHCRNGIVGSRFLRLCQRRKQQSFRRL